jgi:hypothetical protein
MAVAKIACPRKCDHGYTRSWGDGWEEWGECRCCNPNGDNDSGKVTKRRVAQFEKQEAADEALWEQIIADAEARGELR